MTKQLIGRRIGEIDRYKRQADAAYVAVRTAEIAAMDAFVTAHGDATKAAAYLGCSRTYISKVLHGHKGINVKMLGRMRVFIEGEA